MHMAIRITVNRPAFDQEPANRSPLVRRLCAALLFAMALWCFWFNFDFVRYAVTGLFWNQTTGTVTSPGTTSSPTIRFESIDGLSHSFSEDYMLLCGRRTPCWPRRRPLGSGANLFPVPARLRNSSPLNDQNVGLAFAYD
jgi:hypothetical protein